MDISERSEQFSGGNTEVVSVNEKGHRISPFHGVTHAFATLGVAASLAEKAWKRSVSEVKIFSPR
nr:hypothetical protein [Methylomarinum sp. Ch1-1]MDP4523233.1 hypothetical protein [Methylomarinum sp. Ch1-1]